MDNGETASKQTNKQKGNFERFTFDARAKIYKNSLLTSYNKMYVMYVEINKKIIFIQKRYVIKTC